MRWKPWAGAAVVLTTVAGLVWFAGRGADAGAVAREDARKVHCLAPRNRQRLAETAKVIGVARSRSNNVLIWPESNPERPVTVEQWSQSRKDGFDRACHALVVLTARSLLDPKPKPSFLESLLANQALSVVLGGLLTAAVGAFTARRDRRQALTDTLHTAATEYDKAARSYAQAKADSTSGSPPGDELGIRRTELWFAIERQQIPAPWKRALRDRLDKAQTRLLAGPARDFDPEPARDELDRLRGDIAGAAHGQPPVSGGHP